MLLPIHHRNNYILVTEDTSISSQRCTWFHYYLQIILKWSNNSTDKKIKYPVLHKNCTRSKIETYITTKVCTNIAHIQTLRIVGFTIATCIMVLLDNCDKVTLWPRKGKCGSLFLQKIMQFMLCPNFQLVYHSNLGSNLTTTCSGTLFIACRYKAVKQRKKKTELSCFNTASRITYIVHEIQGAKTNKEIILFCYQGRLKDMNIVKQSQWKNKNSLSRFMAP
jgi:hypothetical protein